MSLGKELTDAKRGVWAFGDVWTYLFPFWDVPATWKIEGGKLVHKYEMPQFLNALDWHYRLAKSGYMHPDTLAGNNSTGATLFYSGKHLIQGGGTGAWNLSDHQSGTAANKDYRRGSFNIFAADGKSRPSTFMGSSTSVISYLNARLKPSQIEELLAVADYLAAPYGSREYTMVNFGVEGVHYTMRNGVPTATDAGQKYVQPQTYPFLASPQAVISNQGADVVTKDYAAWQAANVKALYKPVFWNMNISMPQAMSTALAAQSVEDTITDCTHGKKKVSDVQAAIANWKASSGDRLQRWMTENVLDRPAAQPAARQRAGGPRGRLGGRPLLRPAGRAARARAHRRLRTGAGTRPSGGRAADDPARCRASGGTARGRTSPSATCTDRPSEQWTGRWRAPSLPRTSHDFALTLPTAPSAVLLHLARASPDSP